MNLAISACGEKNTLEELYQKLDFDGLSIASWQSKKEYMPKCNVQNCGFNPSNAEASFVLSTRTLRFLKNIETLSCWYSLESSQ